MDPLLTLLQSSFGDCPIIRQNMQASMATQTDVAAAIEARVEAEASGAGYGRQPSGITNRSDGDDYA